MIMRMLFTFTLLIATENAIAQEHNHANHTEIKQSQPTKGTYICPMHPHIHGANGDNCPICGMALVPTASAEDASEEDLSFSEKDRENSHKINPSLLQTIGVKIDTVKQEVFGEEIRAYGRVVPSTRIEQLLTLRTEGWVESLSASALGDPIEKGQELFTLNSPDLISAQADYLTAKAINDQDIAKAAGFRLKQLGIGAKAMTLIEQQKEPLTAVPFYAEASGIVTKLNVRKGDYVKARETLLSIQDLSTIWVEADVPERYLKTLKKGDRATISLPELNKKRLGKVTYIHPTVNPKTRTGKVRVELSNPKGTLKPDSFVDVLFVSKKRHRLAVPTEAILRSSHGSYVLKYLGGGRFKPENVQIGLTSKGLTEVTMGLKTGEKIITSGQFLLDAEANLKAGINALDSADEIQEVNPHAHH